VGVAAAVAIAAAYSNALHVGFHFDDWHVLQDNPHVRTLRSIPRFFVDPDTTTVLRENKDLRPVLMTTFALNYAVSGDATWSYHLVNLCLHWIAVMLVFHLVRTRLWLGNEAVPIAAAAALIVALHPLNSTPVNYLSARSALLTTVFYLSAFATALAGRRLACVVFFVLALLTKTIAVTLPFALLGYWALARVRHKAIRIPWGFLACLVLVAAGGIAYRRLLLPPWTVESARQVGMTPWVYFMTEWSAYLYYLRLFLWPDALVIDRLDYTYARSFLAFQAWGSLLALVVLGALAWRARRRWPALTFAAFWYVVTLAAESSIFPLAEPVNEHRPYLAMLGLGTAAALALWYGARRLAARPLPAFALVVVVAMGALGTATWARNLTWRDDLTLWTDATQKAPGNARAWLNAGHAALVAGRLDEARRMLLEARRLSPCYAYVQMNLSALEVRVNDLAASLRWADEAVRCNPGFALTHHYRGSALERLGRYSEALAEYRAVTAIDTQHTNAWFAQAKLLEREQKWQEAADAYDRALASNPLYTEAAMLAALLYHYQLGKPADAVERYRGVLRLAPRHYGAHFQLAKALLASGREDEARAAWTAFVPLAVEIGDQATLASAPAALRTAPATP
jgi:tetratricopeptide (TPR) repeat protein